MNKSKKHRERGWTRKGEGITVIIFMYLDHHQASSSSIEVLQCSLFLLAPHNYNWSSSSFSWPWSCLVSHCLVIFIAGTKTTTKRNCALRVSLFLPLFVILIIILPGVLKRIAFCLPWAFIAVSSWTNARMGERPQPIEIMMRGRWGRTEEGGRRKAEERRKQATVSRPGWRQTKRNARNSR